MRISAVKASFLSPHPPLYIHNLIQRKNMKFYTKVWEKREKKERKPIFCNPIPKILFPTFEILPNLSNTKVNTLFFIWGHPLVEVEWIVPPQSRPKWKIKLIWKLDPVPGAWHMVSFQKILFPPKPGAWLEGESFNFQFSTFLFVRFCLWFQCIGRKISP